MVDRCDGVRPAVQQQRRAGVPRRVRCLRLVPPVLGMLLKLAAATARRSPGFWLLQQLASSKTLESTQEEGSTGFLFGTAYKRTLESCNAVKGHFAILHFSHLACCCYAYASLCSDRCNRQRASLVQALARPRLVSSDTCNAAPSAALWQVEAQPCRRCSRGRRRPPQVRRTRRRRGRDAL